MKKLFLFILLFSSIAFSQIDSIKNFAYGKITNTLTTSSTVAVLQNNQGDRFPQSTDFNAVIWDWYAYGWNYIPAFWGSSAEIVRVTANSNDSLTITRAQEGTTARAFGTAEHTYYLMEIPTGRFYGNITDSISAHSDSIIAVYDSIAALRSSIVSNTDALKDSVDIVIMTVSPSNMGAQTTVYQPVGGPIAASTTETSVGYSPFGVGGRIHSMYFQSRTNTENNSTVFTLQTGAADATNLSASAIAITVTAGTKNASITGQSVTVTPTTIGNFKIVNSAGSGTITLYTLTLVIRVPLN